MPGNPKRDSMAPNKGRRLVCAGGSLSPRSFWQGALILRLPEVRYEQGKVPAGWSG
ncbi:hypothetical protein MPNT_20095 [Candidatus Methylacidithermus pantelleriae]|uniref:Uncharacterized protein n=1 Tax=Candidatus Methylacidithermus pantelleriae TaxID=2744239 RepID=A0A8J2FNH9_9BACT|nr:hypothetical protein MPNT_20095 [Candidatus Methylacidithermus pantelleriae]